LITRTDSKAQITIWCRDSLLTTSDPFEEFRELCSNSNMLKVYKLNEWDRSSKRSFAYLALEGRLPLAEGKDTPSVSAFMKSIDSSGTLRMLSGLPFYCKLLLDLFRDNQLKDFTDDVSMLRYVTDQMIEREIEKGLIDHRMLEDNGLQDWLEQIATTYIEGRRYAEIDYDEAMQYGRLVIRDGIDDKTQNHILTSLLQFPLFSEGTESGRIAFSHDLIAEALAAGAYTKRIHRSAADIGVRLSNIDLEDPTLLRFIAARMTDREEEAIINALKRESLEGRAFAILLSLILLARPDRDHIKRSQIELEGRDLIGVLFFQRDLSDMSFRQSNLSGVIFHDCVLKNVRFEGAVFNRTRFKGINDLQGAHFGDLYRIQSIYEEKKYLDDPEKIQSWIANITGKHEPSGEPCPTALQIQHLFRKFVSPLGSPRRDNIQYNALCAGKKYFGSPSIDVCVKEIVSAGYLTSHDHRKRYKRVSGDKYTEMVLFVRAGKIGDGLGEVIANLCHKKDCLHQLY
jgi:hypothetical protein